jgi:hypothetical protein
MTNIKTEKKEKKTRFVLDDTADKKIRGAFEKIHAKTETLRETNHAFRMIEKYIADIDKAASKGVPLGVIYTQLYESVGRLGISSATFGQYVRRVRKGTRSPLYESRETRHCRTGARRAKHRAHMQIFALGLVMELALRNAVTEGSENFVDFIENKDAKSLKRDIDKEAFAEAIALIRAGKPLGDAL